MDKREATTGESENPREKPGSRRKFLFPIDGANADDIIPLVCDFVTDADGELFLAAPVTLPEQTPLSMPEPKEEAERHLARVTLEFKQHCDNPPQIHQVLKVGRSRGHMLKEIVDSHSIDTLITDDQPRTGLRSLLGIEAVDEEAIGNNCDTHIVTRTEYPDEFDTVLVPIAGGPHSGLAIDAGLALARQHNATLELLHVFQQGDDKAEQEGREVLEHGLDRVGGFEPVETTIRGETDVPAAVVGASQLYDIVVFGAPREGLIQQFMLGTIPDSVSQTTGGTVIISHHGGADESWIGRWL